MACKPLYSQIPVTQSKVIFESELLDLENFRAEITRQYVMTGNAYDHMRRAKYGRDVVHRPRFSGENISFQDFAKHGFTNGRVSKTW